MLCKARHYVDEINLKALYHAIFSSHLVYGSQIWGQTINVHNKRIFKLQNRAMRIISFSNFSTDSNHMYVYHRIIKLNDLVTMQNCLFVHDSLKRILPKCFEGYFKPLKYLHNNTRSSKMGSLFVPRYFSTQYGLKSLTKKVFWIGITSL